jgi:hypothetical protein
MKRGLVVLDRDEIPEAEWQRRISQVRTRLAAEGVDIALVYGDVFRSDDIGYLTNLCIYWNEGILAVPAEGEAALLTKLSPRVHTWMRRTSTLTDLRSGKSFGGLVAELLAEQAPGTLGLVDATLWPAVVVDEVTAAVPGWAVRPLDDLVRRLRARPSEPELALLRQAAAAMREALEAAVREGLSEYERVSRAERVVRTAGFTDVVVRATGGSVEITGQYRNNWLRMARDLRDELASALRAAVAAARDGATVAGLAKAAGPHLAASGPDWDLRVVDQSDLCTNGEYTNQSADRRLAAGEVVAISVEAVAPDGGELIASDTVLIGESGAEPLNAREVAA